MIDIHCHPLPEIDDGPDSFDEAVEMCRIAANDGITHLVATPHCNYRYPFRPLQNHDKLASLQAAVGENPQLLLGCDFHLSYDNIQRLIEHRGEYTINRTRYVLVEFDDHFIPEQYDSVFYDLQVAGLIPILTHPERNAVFRRKPGLLYRWATKGCLVQVTAQSYTGGFGSEARRFAEFWLDRNLIHFFASDAHDTKHRPPILSACYQKLVETKGRGVAELLMKRNPEAVIKGLPMPPGPQPLSEDEARPKRSWLSFLKRR